MKGDDFRFYLNRTNSSVYLQLWYKKERCLSLGTPAGLVTALLDENKTKRLREKVTKFSKGKMDLFHQKHDSPEKGKVSEENVCG